MTRPNGITTNYSYDNLSRLLSVLHQSGSTTLDGATYTLDNAGNRTAKTDQYANVTSNYTVACPERSRRNPIYELTQVTQATTTTESYTYDAVGNRLSSLGVSPYSVNVSNELTSTPSTTYTYDNNGNTLTSTTGSNTTSYAWDFENRLTSVTLPGSGGTVSFAYDPFGRRIKKVSSAGTSIYAYDGDNLIEETNASGAAVARYSHGENIDEPLAMLRGGATSFYDADGLGSITSLSNAAGALAQTYTFDSFGKTTPTGGLVNPFQYTGRELDSETSLYFLRARFYDQTVGRFLSEDPLGFDAGIDFYTYVSNNPIVVSDPLGLAGCPANVSAYIKQMCSAAKAASGPNCPCHIILIQSGFESAWGTGPTVPDNNFLGLHGVGDKGSRPAKKDPKVKLPIFSTPAAGLGEYCNRIKEKGIGYSNDTQFLNQVVSKLGFAVGGDPAGYKRGIGNMINKCKPDLDSCCSCSQKK